MTGITTLKAEIREGNGTGAARELRRQGKVPAIIYGDKQKEVKISINDKEFFLAYKKGGFKSKIVEINTGKETFMTIPREVQLHPLKDTLVHADFMRVSKDEKIEVMVKVEFINTEQSPGLKRGGVLNIVRHEVELLCQIDSIPEKLIADLSGLEIGDSLHISAIKLPSNVAPTIDDRDFTIASIAGRTAKDDSEETVVVAADAVIVEGEEESAEGAAEEGEESSGDKE